jgi:hypothetical protein
MGAVRIPSGVSGARAAWSRMNVDHRSGFGPSLALWRNGAGGWVAEFGCVQCGAGALQIGGARAGCFWLRSVAAATAATTSGQVLTSGVDRDDTEAPSAQAFQNVLEENSLESISPCHALWPFRSDGPRREARVGRQRLDCPDARHLPGAHSVSHTTIGPVISQYYYLF